MSIDVKKCRRLANSYYNRGLAQAKERDLSGACISLRQSLRWNKYQTDARNLLGLIYYEIGETGQALTQWVISSSLVPENNRANHYLERIRKRQRRLEADDAQIRKYNQALVQARTGNEDLAVLMLKRVVEARPNFIRAQLLHALLCIHEEDYTAAGKSLVKILQIDRYHKKALEYMAITKANTGRAEVEKKKLDQAYSHRQMQDDDIILPPTYRETSGWSAILYIAAGLLLGASVIWFLVVPTVERGLNRSHNQELNLVLERESANRLEAAGLQDQIDRLTEENEKLTEALKVWETDGNVTASEYVLLLQIQQALMTGDQRQAAVLYADVEPDRVTDEGAQQILEALQAQLAESAPGILAAAGNSEKEAGNPEAAAEYYERCIRLLPDSPLTMLELAGCYQSLGREEEALQLYAQIIRDYPDSAAAEQAAEIRGY